MLFIKNKLDSNNCENLYCDLFDEIDRKITQYASTELNNIRYSFTNKVNYNSYEDLILYRSILKNMLYCSDCLCGEDINKIISNIRKITNSIC
jgi:hypothetical protein